jgi:hypothetical protein
VAVTDIVERYLKLKKEYDATPAVQGVFLGMAYDMLWAQMTKEQQQEADRLLREEAERRPR